MKLEITQEDIDNGKPRESVYCPMALAMCRHYPGAIWLVDIFGAVYDNSGELRFKTSADARIFVDRFDNGKSVEPMTIELREI